MLVIRFDLFSQDMIFTLSTFERGNLYAHLGLTLSVPDVISGRGDVGLITLVDVYFAKITLRV